MNVFEYLDDLIFGPTLQYAMQTRYAVDDAVGRLSAAVIPRHSFRGIFGSGLRGSVEPDHVCVRWRSAWGNSGLQPSFRGSFVAGAQGAQLVGTIGVLPAVKALLLFVAMFPPVVLWAIGVPHEPHYPFGILIRLVISFGVIATVAVSRAFVGRHYQVIADALDTALS